MNSAAPLAGRVRHVVSSILSVAALVAATGSVEAQMLDRGPVSIEVEGGPVFTTRNDARKPTDAGTPFSFLDLTGRGPKPFLRAAATFDLAERHSIRIVAAPVRSAGTGEFEMPVLFVDRTFAPLQATEAVYEFNTYRVGYRYLVHRSERWQVHVGATALVRDAKIQLRQNGATATDTDLGVVPLASFGLRRALGDRTALVVDVEGLGARQGRAIDAAAKIEVRLGQGWTLGAGYRTIEGGADVESVFSFAWIHFAVASVGYRF